MKSKNKVIAWLKSLPIGLTGLVAFIGIMLLLTAVFNWFWSGLGEDPTHYYILPFTTNFNDFKEYAALYIPLISFGATLFAGFVVFLVFNDWKEQHNATVYSNLALESLNNFKKLNYYLVSFKDLEANLKEVIDNNFIEQDKRLKAVTNIYENYIENRQELAKLKSIFLHDNIFIAQFKNDANFLSASLGISTKIQDQLDKFNEHVKKIEITKLNSNELFNLISDDNTIFFEIGLKSSKVFLPLLQKYIQQ